MASGTIGTAYVDVAFDESQVRRQVGQLGNQVDRDLGGALKKGEKGFDDLGKSGEKSMGKMSKSAGGLSSAFGGLGKQAGLLAGAFGVGIGIDVLVKGFESAVSASSDLSEQINKAQVVFGSSSKGVISWSKTLVDSFGISSRAALEAAGTFGNMLVPMGFARKDAADMSKRMVELAGDMASFNNASPADTLDAIRAGLAGETEPLRRYGVFLSQARIEQEAFRLGLTKQADAARAAADGVKSAEKGVTEATAERARSQKAVVAATKEEQQTAAAIETAAKQVQAAQDGVTSANDRVAAAHERVRDATRRESDAEDANAEATRRVQDAKQKLADVQRTAKSLQDALTDARKKATDQLLDLRDAAADSGLSEERASLALQRANERLTKVTADTEATTLDQEESLLAVKEAQQAYTEAQRRAKESQRDYDAAQKNGVKGSQVVLDAQQAIADNRKDQAKATRDVTDAEHKLAGSGEKVADAARGVVAAHKDVTRAQQGARKAVEKLRDAHEKLTGAQQTHAAAVKELAGAQAASESSAKRLTTAQDNLRGAQERASKAGEVQAKGLTAQQKTMAAYSLMLKDTKDAQGDFERTNDSLANSQRRLEARTENLKASLGDKLRPAIQDVTGALNDLLDWGVKDAPKLTSAFDDLASNNKTFNEIARDTGEIVDDLAPLFDDLKAVIVDLTPVWKLLGKVALNEIEAMVKGLQGLVTIVDGVAKVVRGILEGDWSLAWEGAKKIVAGLGQIVGAQIDLVKSNLEDVLPAIKRAAAALGRAIVNEAVAEVSDIGADIRRAISDSVTFGEEILAALTNRAESIGRRIIGGAVAILEDAAGGIGAKVRAAVSAGVSFGEGILAAIGGEAGKIGGRIVSAAVGALTGIGDQIREKMLAAVSFGEEFLVNIGKGAKVVGTAIKNAVLGGIAGLGGAIFRRFKSAFLAAYDRFRRLYQKTAGRIPGVPDLPDLGGGDATPNSAGLQATTTAAGGGGTLYGTPQPFAELRRQLSDLGAQTVQPAPTVVRVYIGDEELRGIVRTEVGYADDATARILLAGAR